MQLSPYDHHAHPAGFDKNLSLERERTGWEVKLCLWLDVIINAVQRQIWDNNDYRNQAFS
jgi:hypothetical protein